MKRILILIAACSLFAGCCGTACTIADREFGIPSLGTMAHSWVQLFDSEYEAFKAYAENYPDNCTLLVDTFNVLKSGVPNAIRVFQEMRAKGIPLTNYGIRLDSGDLAYLSKKARKMLDAAGFPDAIISASRRDMLGATIYLVGRDARTNELLHDAMSCSMCKRQIINAGIDTVIVRDDKENYRVISVSEWIENDESLDGSFGYYRTSSATTSQGMRVAVPRTNEGDVNATTIAMGGTIGNCLDALGL